jgi:hypothetical protein
MQQRRQHARSVAMAVAMIMIVAVGVITIVVAVRSAHIVHGIQHARINALPHINNYQARAHAN